MEATQAETVVEQVGMPKPGSWVPGEDSDGNPAVIETRTGLAAVVLRPGGFFDVSLEASSIRVAAAAPDLFAALEDLATITRRSGSVTDAEIARLEDRYGEELTWGDLVEAVNAAVAAALAKAQG